MSQLLSEFDGLHEFPSGGGVMVMAATNRPDLIDESMMRPGRFDETILIPPPPLPARAHILKTLLQRIPHVAHSGDGDGDGDGRGSGNHRGDADRIDIAVLAEMSEGFTGADLAGWCRAAALHALEAIGDGDGDGDGDGRVLVSQSHFLQALANCSRSVTDDMMRELHEWRRTFLSRKI